MFKDYESTKKHLAELATIVNSFKSEAVQLRIVELLFKDIAQNKEDGEQLDTGSKKPLEKKTTKKKKSNSSSDNGAKKSNRGRPGPAVILNRLYTEGFFKKKRMIGDIIAHCSSKLAFQYKTPELSGTLARFVRDGKLDRDKNAEDQYEYVQK